MEMTNVFLLVVIVLMVYCMSTNKKVKKSAEKLCSFPGPQRFDPYNPLSIGRLGQEACCGRPYETLAGKEGYCTELDQSCDIVRTDYGNCDEGFAAGGCCGSCGTCLPNYPGCVPNNQFGGGQLPCNSVGNFWFDYSRLIGDDMAWRVLDAMGWPMTYEQACAVIPIGAVVCWNGQPLARVSAVAQHVNMPMSAFLILDQSFKLNLAGQMVTIRPINVSATPIVAAPKPSMIVAAGGQVVPVAMATSSSPASLVSAAAPSAPISKFKIKPVPVHRY